MRAPLNSVRITPHGDYGYVRTEAEAKRVGYRLCSKAVGYPCTHRGLDLAAKEGTPVYAPEGGYLLYAVDGDDVRPFSRYGPAVLVLKGASGYYHLLAHLAAPNPWGDYRTTDIIAKAQKLSVPLQPQYRIQPDIINQHPEQLPMPMFKIDEGMQLGYVSSAKHVHWEVRKRPDDRTSVINPKDWLASKGKSIADDQSWLWLVLGFLVLKGRR
jgi:peptidase M23-like protein